MTRYELWTYDGPDVGAHTLRGRYRTRWLAEWMGRGLRRYVPPGVRVYVEENHAASPRRPVRRRRPGAKVTMPGETGLPSMARYRLGDCWIEGCLRDACNRVTLTNPDTGEKVTGLLCDEHSKEIA